MIWKIAHIMSDGKSKKSKNQLHMIFWRTKIKAKDWKKIYLNPEWASLGGQMTGNLTFFLYFSVQGGARVGFQLWVRKADFILVLLFTNYCIIFHTNNCKPSFAPPCMRLASMKTHYIKLSWKNKSSRERNRESKRETLLFLKELEI